MLQRRLHEAFWLPAIGWLLALLLLPVALGWVPAASAQQGLTVTIAGFSADGWSRAQPVVTVLDADGRTIAGLSDSDFLARVNGSDVPIVALTQGVDSTLPIAVVLALDISGSMQGSALDQLKLASHGFLDSLGPDDSVSVVTFSDGVSVAQPFTQDRAAAGAAIDGLVAGGATALYQATSESVRLAASAETSRRAVVLLSDGRDNGSPLPREDALAAAAAAGVPLFVIGLGSDIDRTYLRELAQTSAGQFAETPSPEGLAQLYREVGELLRGQYILTLDASELDLAEAEAVTLRVEAATGGALGSDERLVCPQRLCVALRNIADGEQLKEARTVVADVIAADPVESVTFFVGDDAAAELTEPPYEFTFDPASVSGGDHTLVVEVRTAAGETQTGEVTVRVGGGGGAAGLSGNMFAIGAVVIAAAVVALLWLYLRRRRGEREGPQPAAPPDRPSPIPLMRRRRRPLQPDQPPPPPSEPEVVLGRLYATNGPLAGQSFSVGSTPVSIGSGHRCRIRLPSELEGGYEIAPEQARVWIREAHLMVHEVRRLTAIGSVGGHWAILNDGDSFSVGPCTFRFALEQEGEETPKEPVPNVLRGRHAEPVPDILRERPQPAAEGQPAQPPQPVVNIFRDRPESGAAREAAAGEHGQSALPEAATGPDGPGVAAASGP